MASEWVRPEVERREIRLFETPCITPSHIRLQLDEEPDLTKPALENIRAAMVRHADQPFLGVRAGLATSSREVVNRYVYMTYREADALLTELAKAFRQLGIQPGDSVAIMAKNSPLWLLSDYACAAVGAVVVPTYDTLGPTKTLFAFTQAEVSTVLTQVHALPMLLGIWGRCPTLRRIVILDMHSRTLSDIAIDKHVRKAIPTYLDINEKSDQELGLDFTKYRVRHDRSYGFSLLKAGEGLQEREDGEEEVYSTLSTTTTAILQQIEDAERNGELGAAIDAICHDIQLSRGEDGYTCPIISFLPVLLERVKDQPYEGDMKLDVEGVNSIIYTSGTSGNPKGVVHTHRSIMSGISMGYSFFPYQRSAISGKPSTLLSYLPLGHIFERATEYYATIRGLRIAYYSGNTANLSTDIRLAQPTILICVPRVVQKIYDTIMKKVSESRLKSLIFHAAYHVKKWTERFWIAKGTLPLIDHTIFKEIRNSLGGNLEHFVSGSSSIPPDVWNFLRYCTGACVTSGYGSTETGATGLRVLPHDPISHGLGRLASFMEAKVIDRSDVTEFVLERDHIGELLLKGPGVAKEYYQENSLSLQDKDGFFHTGDLVHVDGETGVCSFVRRINMVAKTLMGEYIDIMGVEDAMEASSLIGSAFLHAEPSRSFPICIVIADKAVLAHRLGMSVEDLSKKKDLPAVHKMITETILKEAEICIKRAGFKGFCVPKCCRWFFDIDWTQDTTLMTPSMKKQHRFFRERYAKEIAEMWDELDEFNRRQV
ncbi:putative Long chain fatty acid CoA ligase [Giardia muris]|uniref:Putative Long chain fatty acid CoA ligase n=1 Tax=Giardia muris TaxID=5742 RepID=A0A4Z1SVE2_GIAMU|nr:putative Long chain fatty acid CoA ligase [Giardia muris]|eukprot:TNJ28885.1 putative Long chain fatty acid CoA ligase [Giardia muris]